MRIEKAPFRLDPQVKLKQLPLTGELPSFPTWTAELKEAPARLICRVLHSFRAGANRPDIASFSAAGTGFSVTRARGTFHQPN